MFRSKGSLIYKDYTLYEGVIDLLLGEKYDVLWKKGYFEKLLMGGDVIPDNDERIDLIFDLEKQIREYLNGHKIIRSHCSGPEPFGTTDTMITKILLGTLACTPAYDTYFPIGLKECGIREYGSFSRKSFVRLLNICIENNLCARLKKQPVEYYGINYPIMRVIDLYFWTKGFNAEEGAN
jgi:hypothetical protein